MKILFVHNNFPAQFKHLAPALAASGEHEVASISLEPKSVEGVTSFTYKPARGSSADIHPWLLDFETKIIRGQACFELARSLKQRGYYPDCIIAHPGWGEALFLKDIWPNAKLGLYCELYYRDRGFDYGFESNYEGVTEEDACRFRIKNLNNDLTLEVADACISPTRWQASSYPKSIQEIMTVVHDGIDTDFIKPDSTVAITLNGETLTKEDEVVTFVNRNLEPYRGYHTLMRALPILLSKRIHAKVLIIGGDGLSYGSPPPQGKSWKQIYIDEVFPQLAAQERARVFFLGNLPYDKYLSVLRISSVHVYLTYPFVLGWSMLEAMSLECCLVASETSPVTELVKDGENGILVPFDNHRNLAEKISKLLSDQSLRIKLGKNARKTIVNGFDLRNVCLPKQVDWVKKLAQR